MKRNRLKYAGRGQIVREADGRLVSPRDVVTWFNDVCDVADELHKTLTSVLDALAFAQQLKSPAEGVQSQNLRNGETEARRAGVSQYPCRKRGRGVKPG